MSATVTRPVAVKLDPSTRERMKRLADAKHRTPHWLMREAIDQYVDREQTDRRVSKPDPVEPFGIPSIRKAERCSVARNDVYHNSIGCPSTTDRDMLVRLQLRMSSPSCVEQ